MASPFLEDRAALGALATAGVLTAQQLPRLFHHLADLERLSSRGLGELDASDVASPHALREIRGGDARLAELLFCDMQLACSAFVRQTRALTHARVELALGPLTDALGRLAVHAPALANAEVVLTAALGRSGRVYLDAPRPVIYAGLPREAPTPFDTIALLVLHELAVVLGPGSYRLAERASLDAVTTLVAGTPFATPFARRVERLDLSAIASSKEARDATADVLKRLRGG